MIFINLFVAKITRTNQKCSHFFAQSETFFFFCTTKMVFPDFSLDSFSLFFDNENEK